MKYISTAILLPFLLLSFASQASAQAVFPNRGGTGTSVIPTYGQVLVGNTNGTYTPSATSSLGLAPALSGGALNALTYWTGSGSLGATTSPTVGYLTATSSTASSTFQGLQATTLKLGTLSGVLKAVNGWITTALVNLATDVTGILGIANGGTGTSTQIASGVNYFDGSRITSGTGLTFTGSALGLNKTSPSYQLHMVATTSTAAASMMLQDQAGRQFLIQSPAAGGGALLQEQSTTGTFIINNQGNNNVGDLVLQTGGTNYIYLRNSTEARPIVGIGETSGATSTLAVHGNVAIGSSNTFARNYAPAGGLTVEGNVGIGTTSPNTTLNIYSPQSASTANQLEIDDGTTGGYFAIAEGTSVANAYLPTFIGRSAGINGFALSFSGQMPVANDTPFNSQNLDGAILFTASRVGGAGLTAANVFNVRNGGSSYFLINAAGKIGIGTTTPAANLQVTTINSNATSSLQVGKANQTKGSCVTFYDSAGTPVYMYFAAGSTAPTYTSTQPSGCGN